MLPFIHQPVSTSAPARAAFGHSSQSSLPALPQFGGEFWTRMHREDVADLTQPGWTEEMLDADTGKGHETVAGYRAPGSRPLARYTGPLDHGTSIDRWPAYIIAPKDQPLQTSRMRRCAALVVVGPDRHYLLHVNPMPAQYIAQHLRDTIDWDLSKSQLYLVPGTKQGTEKTVKNLMFALNELDPQLPGKVRFMHYPLSEVRSQVGDDAEDTAADRMSLVSHQGKVYYRPLENGDFDFPMDGWEILPGATPHRASSKGLK